MKCFLNYRETNAITTATAVPVSSRSPTTATTAPATAPALELSVEYLSVYVTFPSALECPVTVRVGEVLCTPGVAHTQGLLVGPARE